ncbi:MAG: HAD-IB family hydrolase [Parachlamydiaceae bacterium]
MIPSTPPIALFDFDRTLTDRDSLLPFLFYVQGFFKTLYLLICLTPFFIGYLFRFLSRQQIKEKILHQFIGGKSYAQLCELAEQYANNQLDRYLKPEAVKRLLWHQSMGHRCLLVSASLDFYLIPWAKRYGFESVLASQLEVQPDGKVTGLLKGLNCWGGEKKRRILAYFGERGHGELYAYGDSRGDQEMLALADHPFYRRFP